MPVVMRGAPAPPKRKPASTPEEHCAVLGVTIRELGLEPWDPAKLDAAYKRAAAVAHPNYSRSGSAEAFQAVQASFEALSAMARDQQWGTSSSTYGRGQRLSLDEISKEKITFNGRTDAFGSPYIADVSPPKATLLQY